MSLKSLFSNPEYLIKRFRYLALYPSSVGVYFFIAIISIGLLYLFISFPAYFIIGCGILVPLILFVNKVFEAIIHSRYFEVKCNSETDIYRDVQSIKEDLGFNKPIKIYLRRGAPEVKSMSLFGVRRIFIGSELIKPEINKNQYNYAIAQAILLFKIRRMFFSFFEPFVDELERLFIFNVFLYAFDRASCYTADRIASLYAGSHEYAKKLMRIKLIGDNEFYVKIDEFIKQAEKNDDFYGWLVNVFSKYPSTVRRMRAIQMFYEKYMILYAKRHESDEESAGKIPITLQI